MEGSVRRAFDSLPKTRHWRTDARYKHPEATPEKIMEAINEPTLVIHQSDGRTVYLRFRPQEDNWFRVVLDEGGVLRTAFRDDQTMRTRGRP